MVVKGPASWPHRLLIPKIKEEQWRADDWCTEKFGPRWNAIDYREGTWCCFWAGRLAPKCYEWFFKNEHDAALFLLRWS